MNCSGCGHAATAEVYEGNYTPKVEIDVCHHCNSLWFDGRESLALSPGSIVKLFESMYLRREAARQPHQALKTCPRCQAELKETFDKRLNTRFTYYRCDAHGRLITFFQFLREKGFVHEASELELEELRAKVKQVQCSNCGAPVPISQASHCEHCQAPICFLGSENLTSTLKNLADKEAKRTQVDPTVAARMVMDKMSVQRLYREFEQDERGYRFNGGADLLSMGLKALLRVL